MKKITDKKRSHKHFAQTRSAPFPHYLTVQKNVSFFPISVCTAPIRWPSHNFSYFHLSCFFFLARRFSLLHTKNVYVCKKIIIKFIWKSFFAPRACVYCEYIQYILIKKEWKKSPSIILFNMIKCMQCLYTNNRNYSIRKRLRYKVKIFQWPYIQNLPHPIKKPFSYLHT